jgi:TPR repeat protein
MASAAVAGPYEVAQDAYQRADYETAFQAWKPLADQGNVDAEYMLGHMYDQGLGVARDAVETKSWYEKAAEQGLAHAQCALGMMPLRSPGGEEQSSQKLSESTKDDTRPFNVSEDITITTIVKYGRTDGAGNNQELVYSQAQTNVLYNMRQDGAKPRNVLKSIESDAERGRESVDYGVALRWLYKAAAQGDACGQYGIGRFYYGGYGVAKDYGSAVYWFRKAADKGDADAQASLGVLYYNGEGLMQDYESAAKLWRVAAGAGEATAPLALGMMYSNGEGVRRDYLVAYIWFSLAAARTNDENLHEMAVRARDRVKADVAPCEIAEAQRIARTWDASDPNSVPTISYGNIPGCKIN